MTVIHTLSAFAAGALALSAAGAVQAQTPYASDPAAKADRVWITVMEFLRRMP